VDRIIGKLLRLRGDFVPDYRLVDYFVALMSTPRSPALDGRPGSAERLKADLTELGVFDERMALYLPYRLRTMQKTGFSGFEGRYYSAFGSFENDLARAVEVQNLVTALAFQYVADGTVQHEDIPDDPIVESERRQTFFAAAVGVGTFSVQADTSNRFLLKILKATPGVRASRRYMNSLRVHTRDYLLGLLATVRRDGAELIESLELEESLADLKERLADPENSSAVGRLVKGILSEAGARRPLDMAADEFNRAAEKYFRETLRFAQVREAIEILKDESARLEHDWAELDPELKESLGEILHGQTTTDCVALLGTARNLDRLDVDQLVKRIRLLLVIIQRNSAEVNRSD
jgi:hypothetical protein